MKVQIIEELMILIDRLNLFNNNEIKFFQDELKKKHANISKHYEIKDSNKN
jgi:hypothetical protein